MDRQGSENASSASRAGKVARVTGGTERNLVLEVTPEVFDNLLAAHGGQAFVRAGSASKAALAALTRNTAPAVASNRIRAEGLTIVRMAPPGRDATMSEANIDFDQVVEGVADAPPTAAA